MKPPRQNAFELPVKQFVTLPAERPCLQCHGSTYCPFCYGQGSNVYCRHCDCTRVCDRCLGTGIEPREQPQRHEPQRGRI